MGKINGIVQIIIHCYCTMALLHFNLIIIVVIIITTIIVAIIIILTTIIIIPTLVIKVSGGQMLG